MAISEYNRRMILNHCGPQAADKVHVIHCGVDRRQFQARGRVAGGRPETGPFSILCIGTVHEVKGQSILVEACQLLKERGLDFTLHFVGDGPGLVRLRQHVEKLGLADRVTLHGRKTRDEIIKLLREADVLAAPSVPTRDGRREGIPVVLIEAMASGVPVVASRLSGIPELVEDGVCGLLVPPRDPHTLAEALTRLADDPTLRRGFAEAARRRIEHDFDLQTCAAKLVARFHKSGAPPASVLSDELQPRTPPAEMPS